MPIASKIHCFPDRCCCLHGTFLVRYTLFHVWPPESSSSSKAVHEYSAIIIRNNITYRLANTGGIVGVKNTYRLTGDPSVSVDNKYRRTCSPLYHDRHIDDKPRWNVNDKSGQLSMLTSQRYWSQAGPSMSKWQI